MNAILTKRSFNSISSKLTLLLALASGLALLISGVAFVVNDVLMLRENKARELTSVAKVIAANSAAALAFDQAKSAEALLTSLRDRSDITAARLFDSQGAFFASYAAETDGDDRGSESAVSLATLDKTGHRVTEEGMLEVTWPVSDRGKHLGYVQLRATTGELYGQLHRYGGIATSVILASLVVAITLGARLQRSVSDPLLRLATVIKRVNQDGDYSVRVEKPSNDEIGELYDEFNSMLARIDFADVTRQQKHDELEERTLALDQHLRERTNQLLDARAELELTESRVRAIIGLVRGSEITELNKVLNLVNEQRDDLSGFLETDRRGKQLPKELIEAGRTLSLQRDSLLASLDDLTAHLEGIRDVVTTQPSPSSAAPGHSHSSA